MIPRPSLTRPDEMLRFHTWLRHVHRERSYCDLFPRPPEARRESFYLRFATLLKDRIMTAHNVYFSPLRIDSARVLPRLIGGRRI